jgi:hypothetical protein
VRRQETPLSGELTLFSFGYYGWGGHLRKLVALTDAVEAKRGFGPPVFVDVRLRRAGRAPGFQGNDLERLLGHDRYRWMRTLGNRSIKTRRRRIDIAAPDAAHQLLDLALDLERGRRRVIFFCACELPCDCHRRKVARLVVAAARSRRVRLAVVEWPGTPMPTAVAHTFRVQPKMFDDIMDGKLWMPLPPPLSTAKVGLLANGDVARVQVQAGTKRGLVVLGRVRPHQGGWEVETWNRRREHSGIDVRQAIREGRLHRTRLGYVSLAT